MDEKMKKIGEINNLKNSEINAVSPEEDLKFILFKAELNKELLAFWNSINKK